MFASKIASEVKARGVQCLISSSEQQIFSIIEKNENVLLIFDLHSEKINPFALVQQLEMQYAPTCSFITAAYYGHVQSELKEQAEEVGIDYIFTRGDIMNHINELLQVFTL